MIDPDEDHEEDERVELDPELEADAQLNDRRYQDWLDRTPGQIRQDEGEE